MKMAFISCLLLPLYVFSGGYQTNLQSVRAMGMGHCGIASSNDASALFFNPAQISSLAATSGIQIGFTPVFAHTLYQMPGSNYSARTEPGMGTPFHVYAYTSINKSKSLKAGLAVYTPYGSGVQWPQNWKGQFLLREIDLKSIFIQPTISYAVNDKWSVGAGFVLATGGFSLRRAIPLQNTNTDYGEGILEGSGRGMGWQVGIQYKASEQWQFGLSYRSLVRMRVKEGEALFTTPASVASNFPNTGFQAELPLPGNLSLGASYTLNKHLRLVADIQGVQWQAYDSLNITFAQETDRLKSIRSARNYKNAIIARIGAEFQLNKVMMLRAGAYFDQTPVQAGYLTPETPDAHKIGITSGFSYALKPNCHIDLALLYIHGQRRSDVNLETAFAANYQSKALCAGIGFRWQKQENKKSTTPSL